MLTAIFCALVGLFVVIASVMVVPAFRGYMSFLPMSVLVIAYFSLGLALIFLTLKRKVRGMLKRFLILTGASSAGFLVSVWLHNAFYGLEIVTSHFALLSYLMGFLHVAFFIAAVLLCPLGFLIGVVGSVVLFIRKRRSGKLQYISHLHPDFNTFLLRW
jgi:hypothetical protein